MSEGERMGRERTNPFHGLLDSMSEWNRMRELGMGKIGYETGHEDRQRTHATAWIPAADMFARGRDLVIRVSLSGVNREDVHVAFHENVLTISGERKSDLNEEEVTFYTRERYYGAFRRSTTLPAGIDESKISADFENGLLEISVKGGATAATEPHRIEIRDRSG